MSGNHKFDKTFVTAVSSLSYLIDLPLAAGLVTSFRFISVA